MVENLKTIDTVDTRPFKKLVMTIGELPTSFVESMTYYEMLAWLLNYLETVIIPTINNNGEAIKELQDLFEELKEFVDSYFDNLDIQEEVDKKLDEMAEDGRLEEIIAEYLRLTSVLGFDNVDALKNGTNLINGNFAETFGFHTKGDGGGGKYIIRDKTSGDTPNDITLISLTDPTLVAELIIKNNEVNIKQFGCVADGITDDTSNLQFAIDFAKEKGYYVRLIGWCKVTSPINTKGVKLKGNGKLPMMTARYMSKTYGNIGWDYLRNVNNGALITFNDFVGDYLTTGAGICSENASPIIFCHHNDGKFDLENIGIAGWIRTANQEGIKSTYENVAEGSYINGNHNFNNVNVFNCGGNGIHLQSLECVKVNNLRSQFNFGKGLYIEGNTLYDTPFEYVNFDSCWFTHNKGEGVHAYKCFRKDVTFSHCNSSANGLYNQLNISVPTTTPDITPSYKIEGYNGFVNSLQSILNFKNCYGEEQPVMISVIGYENNHPFNKITVENCTSYPFGQRSANALIYLDQHRLNYLSVTNNYTQFTSESGANQIVFSSNVGIVIPYECDGNFYDKYMAKILPEITINSNLNVGASSFERYDNIIYLHLIATATANIAAYGTLVGNLPKPKETIGTVININNTSARASLYTNRNLQTPTAISSGDVITIDLVYPVLYFSDKNGQ